MALSGRIGSSGAAALGAVLLVAMVAASAPSARPARRTAPAKRCHFVLKRVHGKRKRVRVCRKTKPFPSAGKIVATIRVDNPMGFAETPGAVWVAEHRSPTIARIDPATNRVTARVRVASGEAQPARLAYAGGFLWAIHYSTNQIVQVDPATNTALATIATPKEGCCVPAVGAGSVWSLGFDDTSSVLIRLDPATAKVVATVPLPPSDGVAFANGFVWGVTFDGTLWRVDPASNSVAGSYPKVVPRAESQPMIAAAGALWLTNAKVGVVRVDPSTAAVGARIKVPHPTAIGGNDRSIWTADEEPSGVTRVYRINPATNKVSGRVTLPISTSVEDILVADSGVWVSMFDASRVVRIRPKS
jgi:streptogramin lyase